MRGFRESRTPPVGQITRNLSSPGGKNILLYRNSDLAYMSFHPIRHEGRSYVVTKRGLGMRWTRQRRAREGVAGRACARERSAGAQTNGAEKRLRLASRVSTRQPSKIRRGRPRTAKSCGPGARSWRQARGGGLHPTGCEMPRDPRGDGGNRARLTGEITKQAVKTIRAGKAGMSTAEPVVHPCAFPCARTAGASRRPVFPAPSVPQEGTELSKTSGAIRVAGM